jgi:hypothetical protein
MQPTRHSGFVLGIKSDFVSLHESACVFRFAIPKLRQVLREIAIESKKGVKI